MAPLSPPDLKPDISLLNCNNNNNNINNNLNSLISNHNTSPTPSTAGHNTFSPIAQLMNNGPSSPLSSLGSGSGSIITLHQVKLQSPSPSNASSSSTLSGPTTTTPPASNMGNGNTNGKQQQYPPNHPLSGSKHLCSICGDRASGKHYGVYRWVPNHGTFSGSLDCGIAKVNLIRSQVSFSAALANLRGFASMKIEISLDPIPARCEIARLSCALVKKQLR